MFFAIHPTTYRSGGFLAHGVLNAINDICLKLGMKESHYTVDMHGTGKMDLIKIQDHIDTRV